MALIFSASRAGSVVTAKRPHMTPWWQSHPTREDGPVSTWPAPVAPSPVHATVTIPGSKSQTNRALVLAALAAAQGQGSSSIGGALRSRDTDLMIGALRSLGLRVDGDGTELTVSGRIAPDADARVDCGLAGTVLRFRSAAGGAGRCRR